VSTRTMMRVPVLVYADDPVTKSGVEAQLRGRPGVELRELDTWRIDSHGLNGVNGVNGLNGLNGRSGANGRSGLQGLNGHGGLNGGNGHGLNGHSLDGSANGGGPVNGALRGPANGMVAPSGIGDDGSPATVAVVVVDEVDERAVRTIRALARGEGTRVLVVAGRLDDSSVLAITEAGACGLLRRSEAVPERLVPAVTAAAAGEGTIPPDLLGRLLEQVGHLQRQVLSPRGLTFSGLTERELQVLRLVADGHDTAEIAKLLAYSERTVKNIIHDVTSRLQLKNRSHAVAWAMRQGLL
jgi:DNA-binding NarL/FixJ family response regulator